MDRSTRSITDVINPRKAPHRTKRQINLSARTNLIGKCCQVLRRFWAHLRRERRIRKAAAELAQLDDRLLRDIGVARSQIERVIRYGRDYQ